MLYDLNAGNQREINQVRNLLNYKKSINPCVAPDKRKE